MNNPTIISDVIELVDKANKFDVIKATLNVSSNLVVERINHLMLISAASDTRCDKCKKTTHEKSLIFEDDKFICLSCSE